MDITIFDPPKRSMSMLLQCLSLQDLSMYIFMQVCLGYRDNNKALHFGTQALDFADLMLSKG